MNLSEFLCTEISSKFSQGFIKIGVDNSMKMEIASEIADYIIESTGGCADVVKGENGDETLTDEAQDLFNEHYDRITSIIEKCLGVIE